jgi:hypothetical protein
MTELADLNMSEDVRKLNVSEAQIKKAVEEYLQYGKNQGRWFFLRLQSGSFLVDYGHHKNKINLCPKGTADYEVFQSYAPHGCGHLEICRLTFLEIKSTTGKQSPEQVEFQTMAEGQNARYFVVRDAGKLEEILR